MEGYGQIAGSLIELESMGEGQAGVDGNWEWEWHEVVAMEGPRLESVQKGHRRLTSVIAPSSLTETKWPGTRKSPLTSVDSVEVA